VNRSSELTYTPAWWVPGAHLQTLWGKFFRRIPVVHTRSERWTTPDGDELELRRLDAPAGASPETPRLLVLHGLEGTIHSHYLRGTLALAAQRGWAVDILIFRGCNGEVNRTRRLYHSGETTDLDFVARRLAATEPERPLVVAGFSLGGNVLLKWLGEQGSAVPPQLRAAAAISVPFDLERGSRHIERGFSRLYTRHFLRSLRVKALAKLERFPELFDRAALNRARTLFDFDEAVTAPVHGFAGAHEYYTRSSSIHFLSDIRIPTLVLNARDDPFLPRSVLDDVRKVSEDTAFITAEFPEKGGHVGFVSGRFPHQAQFYAEDRLIDFLGCEVISHRCSTTAVKPL
jgi:predicted alpha/beta-fold hydrolase